MERPTRRRRRRGPNSDEDEHPPTVEERAWPDEARVLSVMAHGFTYAEAWHMSHRDYRRYAGLARAWSIPFDQRESVTFRPTARDAEDFT